MIVSISGITVYPSVLVTGHLTHMLRSWRNLQTLPPDQHDEQSQILEQIIIGETRRVTSSQGSLKLVEVDAIWHIVGYAFGLERGAGHEYSTRHHIYVLYKGF